MQEVDCRINLSFSSTGRHGGPLAGTDLPSPVVTQTHEAKAAKYSVWSTFAGIATYVVNVVRITPSPAQTRIG